MVENKRHQIGVGVYPEVSLAVARAREAEMKDEIRRGIDPAEQKKVVRSSLEPAQRRGLTFAVAVDRYPPM